MECNKDEAERCRALADQFFASGDTAKANKFYKKSKSLFPSAGIDDLINKTEVTEQTPVNNNSIPTNAPDPTPTAAPASTPNYSQEEYAVVQRVLRSTTHYETLELAIGTSAPDEIKKQYRKVSIFKI